MKLHLTLRISKLIFLVVFTSTICQLGWATNYYVSITGSDSNNGTTPASSFASIQKAADLMVAGDSVIVEDGTYAGFDFRSVDGTSTAPIVFFANGDQVVINAQGPIRQDGINIENADYVVVDGFVVVGMINGGNGIRVVTSNNCIVRNSNCDLNDERGIFTAFTDDILIEYNVCTNSVDEHGIYVSNSSDRPIIRYNECYGNNNIGIHMNGDLSAGGDGIISDAQIYGNVLHDNNLAAGINMDGCEDPIVYNNLIYNNHNAQGIALFQIDGAIPTSGAKVYNNTILVPDDGRWGILVKDGSNVGTEIYNNIIINDHSFRGCITVEDTTGLKSDYNILEDKMSIAGDGVAISLAQWQALGFDLNSQLLGNINDLFVDYVQGDFHINMGSQANNTGTALVNAIVVDDIEGLIRPQGGQYDIGCYEYEEGVISSDVYLNENTICLFPNPTPGIFKISGITNLYSIKILDAQGNVYQNLSNSSSPIEINISSLPPGTYLVSIQEHMNSPQSLQQIIKM